MPPSVIDQEARCDPVRDEVLEYLGWCRDVLSSPQGLLHHPSVRAAVAEVLHAVAREVAP